MVLLPKVRCCCLCAVAGSQLTGWWRHWHGIPLLHNLIQPLRSGMANEGVAPHPPLILQNSGSSGPLRDGPEAHVCVQAHNLCNIWCSGQCRSKRKGLQGFAQVVNCVGCDPVLLCAVLFYVLEHYRCGRWTVLGGNSVWPKLRQAATATLVYICTAPLDRTVLRLRSLYLGMVLILSKVARTRISVALVLSDAWSKHPLAAHL